MDVQLTRSVFWFVSAFLIVAATIDGWKLKVPNWLTFPLAGGLDLSRARRRRLGIVGLVRRFGRRLGLVPADLRDRLDGRGRRQVVRGLRLLGRTGHRVPDVSGRALRRRGDGDLDDDLQRQPGPADSDDEGAGLGSVHPSRSGQVVNGRRRAEAEDDALAVRHSDRGRLDRLSRGASPAALKAGFTMKSPRLFLLNRMIARLLEGGAGG